MTVEDAIAQQEEHIKRTLSCREVVGTPHKWSRFGNSLTREAYSACIVCGVTETDADYQIRIARA